MGRGGALNKQTRSLNRKNNKWNMLVSTWLKNKGRAFYHRVTEILYKNDFETKCECKTACK